MCGRNDFGRQSGKLHPPDTPEVHFDEVCGIASAGLIASNGVATCPSTLAENAGAGTLVATRQQGSTFILEDDFSEPPGSRLRLDASCLSGCFSNPQYVAVSLGLADWEAPPSSSGAAAHGLRTRSGASRLPARGKGGKGVSGTLSSWSPFPIPYSLFPVPYSLLPTAFVQFPSRA